MASLVDPQKVQVSNRFELSIRRAIDSVLRQRGRLKLGAVGVVQVVDHQLGSIPVANPVQVAGPDEDVDAALHNLGQGLEERPSLVAGGNDLGIRAGRALAVGALSANGRHDGRVGQVVCVGLRGVGGLGAGWLSNIVDVEVVGLLDGRLPIVPGCKVSEIVIESKNPSMGL